MAKSLFDSRKKIVEVIEIDGKKCIKKTYTDNLSFKKEVSALSRMSATGYCPKVVEVGSSFIVVEFIEGELLSKRYADLTRAEDFIGLERLADMISIFLQIFYSCCNEYTIYDIQFDNFMIRDGRVCCLDFEDCVEGMEYRDVAGIVAIALLDCVGEMITALPFIKKVLQNFRYEIMDIINEVKEYIDEIKQKRNDLIDTDEILSCLLHLMEAA